MSVTVFLSRCVWVFSSWWVFLLSITDWSCSDVLILYSSCQCFWNSVIMCSEPGKLVIGSHVSSLSRGKSHHPIRNWTPFVDWTVPFPRFCTLFWRQWTKKVFFCFFSFLRIFFPSLSSSKFYLSSTIDNLSLVIDSWLIRGLSYR